MMLTNDHMAVNTRALLPAALPSVSQGPSSSAHIEEVSVQEQQVREVFSCSAVSELFGTL